MLLPIVGIPKTVEQTMEKYRGVFKREEGYEHVSRYVSGLIVSPNKTVQGIYDAQVWEGEEPSRRAMHAAVFEAGWSSKELMAEHREELGAEYRSKGRATISIDWTYVHHDRGPHIHAVAKAYDHVEKRASLFQTVVTAVVSNRELIDGIELVVQQPSKVEEEIAYLKASAQQNYQQMEQVEKRLLELMHHFKHKLEYKKRTEIAVEIVRQIEAEGAFPQANYAFDNGVLNIDLTRLIEESGKHWVSELESSRNINWQGKWRRIDEVALELQKQHPESFRKLKVKCRNGEEKEFWAFTKVVRLKRYGRKRIVIVHEVADLSDPPRFLITDALHWESGRVIESWSYRWASEIFHEFGKQVTGLESAQLRKEEAVKRHFYLSSIAQSIVQRAPAIESKSEKFEFAKGKITFGQKARTIARQCFLNMLNLVKYLFAQGHSSQQVLDFVMPA